MPRWSFGGGRVVGEYQASNFTSRRRRRRRRVPIKRRLRRVERVTRLLTRRKIDVIALQTVAPIPLGSAAFKFVLWNGIVQGAGQDAVTGNQFWRNMCEIRCQVNLQTIGSPGAVNYRPVMIYYRMMIVECRDFQLAGGTVAALPDPAEILDSTAAFGPGDPFSIMCTYRPKHVAENAGQRNRDFRVLYDRVGSITAANTAVNNKGEDIWVVRLKKKLGVQRYTQAAFSLANTENPIYILMWSTRADVADGFRLFFNFIPTVWFTDIGA